MQPSSFVEQSHCFDALDRIYETRRPSPQELELFGTYALTDTQIIETPPYVRGAGNILTNPSQIELLRCLKKDESALLPFAYFRNEPPKLHLGKTRAEPYLIFRDKAGKPRLSEFNEASELPGEDPRVTRNVKLRGPTGKVHNGWLISTVIAQPKADNPEVASNIKQVFFWGETLNSLEPINELPEIKNTCAYPLNTDDFDTSADVFGRPHPHITYIRVPAIDQLTEEMVHEGINITSDYLPPNFHVGPNFVKGVARHPLYRDLDIHTSFVEHTSADKKILHYRIERAGFRLPNRDFPRGFLFFLGVTATSSKFAGATPKPPDACVESYGDIVYGSLGHPSNGIMVTGVTDSCSGIARIVRL